MNILWFSRDYPVIAGRYFSRLRVRRWLLNQKYSCQKAPNLVLQVPAQVSAFLARCPTPRIIAHFGLDFR